MRIRSTKQVAPSFDAFLEQEPKEKASCGLPIIHDILHREYNRLRTNLAWWSAQ